MITVMQNFICTVPERLELVKKNTPKVAEVWGDYPFIVNYNHKENFEEIHSIYKEHFPKLDFYLPLKEPGPRSMLSLSHLQILSSQ